MVSQSKKSSKKKKDKKKKKETEKSEEEEESEKSSKKKPKKDAKKDKKKKKDGGSAKDSELKALSRFQAKPMREFYENTALTKVLFEGLREVGRERPDNPIKFLGKYLLDNDPDN